MVLIVLAVSGPELTVALHNWNECNGSTRHFPVVPKYDTVECAGWPLPQVASGWLQALADNGHWPGRYDHIWDGRLGGMGWGGWNEAAMGAGRREERPGPGRGQIKQ